MLTQQQQGKYELALAKSLALQARRANTAAVLHVPWTQQSPPYAPVSFPRKPASLKTGDGWKRRDAPLAGVCRHPRMPGSSSSTLLREASLLYCKCTFEERGMC